MPSLKIYKSIDDSSGRLTEILENYQNALYVYANEENELGLLMKEFGKQDKTTAGKMMSITGKCLTESSLERIKLYKPLIRLLHEMDTFHSRAVEDTKETVDKMEDKRTQYRASLLWMKNISEKLNPDVYKQLSKFRHVQSQVKHDKQVFDSIKMDVVQKIDLLLGSRCNLLNQTLAPYQDIMLDTFQKNVDIYHEAQESIKQLDIHEYEFKALKQLNPLKLRDSPTIEREFELLNFDSSPSGGASPASRGSPTDPVDPSKQISATTTQKNDTDSLIDIDKSPAKLSRNSLSNSLSNLLGLTSPSIISASSTTAKSAITETNNNCLSAHSTLEGSGGSQEPSCLIDLLSNELEEIDNSSYFKSLQKLEL